MGQHGCAPPHSLSTSTSFVHLRILCPPPHPPRVCKWISMGVHLGASDDVYISWGRRMLYGRRLMELRPQQLLLQVWKCKCGVGGISTAATAAGAQLCAQCTLRMHAYVHFLLLFLSFSLLFLLLCVRRMHPSGAPADCKLANAMCTCLWRGCGGGCYRIVALWSYHHSSAAASVEVKGWCQGGVLIH